MKQRRKAKVIARCLSFLILALGVCGGLTSCSRQTVYTSTYFDVFDTVVTLHIVAPTPQKATKTADDIHALVLELHQEFDIYHTYKGKNNLKTINDNAGKATPVPVSTHIIDLLTLGQEIYEASQGKVNIAMGAVLSLWHEHRQKGQSIPTQDALQNANQSCHIEDMVVDKANKTVMLKDANMSLDVGAIAKGYVASKVLTYAKEHQIDSLLMDLGGHILALGEKPDGKSWQVGIRDARDGGVYTTLMVKAASVVTSGNDQRKFEVDGVTYHHIIDPQTLMPANHHASVTVVVPHEHIALADGLSTAAFLMSEKEGKAMLSQISEDIQGIWIPIAN